MVSGGVRADLDVAAHHDAAQTRAQTFNRIGGILVGLNDFDAALKAFDTALLIYKKLKGGECVEVGQTIHNIAEVYDLQSDYEKAQEFFKEAHCIFVNGTCFIFRFRSGNGIYCER